MARQMCTFNWQDKSSSVNGKTKVSRLNWKTKVYV